MTVESKPPTWPKNELLEGIGIPDPIADLADGIIEQGMNDIREFRGLCVDPTEPVISTTSLIQKVGKEHTGTTLICFGSTIKELRYILDTGEHDQYAFDTNLAGIARKLDYDDWRLSIAPTVKIELDHLDRIRKMAHHTPSLFFFIRYERLMPKDLRNSLEEMGALKRMKMLISNYIEAVEEITIPENPVNDPIVQVNRLDEIDEYLENLDAHMDSVRPKPKPAPEIEQEALEEFRNRFESEDYAG